jgi:hypothetical protein
MDTFKILPCYETKLFKNDFFKNKFINFCQLASEETDTPAHENMYTKDWETNSKTLLYHVFISRRFYSNNGELYVLVKNEDEIIGTSGIYTSNFDPNISIAGSRAWILKKYRGKILLNNHRGPYALEDQIEWAKQKNMKIVAFTFNVYNKNFVHYFNRAGLGYQNRNKRFFNLKFNSLKFPVNIQNTKQWIVYYNIDDSYNFNWKKLQWVE